jgi:hypothetical protein
MAVDDSFTLSPAFQGRLREGRLRGSGLARHQTLTKGRFHGTLVILPSYPVVAYDFQFSETTPTERAVRAPR